VVWTIGHSNHPVEALIATLISARIELLVDVRRYPGSSRNPQFNRDVLAATLARHRIEYIHAAGLGGRRQPLPESANTGLRNAGFRGFADYMTTMEFNAALDWLIETAGARRAVIMCAESLPWRCHRSLISDALMARGIEVEHLFGGNARMHRLTPAAKIEGGQVTYPAA
jgi:uncharacterized protein (DUF488 family)